MIKEKNIDRYSEKFIEDEDTAKPKEQQVNPQIVKDIYGRLDQLDAQLDRITELMCHHLNINTQQHAFPIIERP